MNLTESVTPSPNKWFRRSGAFAGALLDPDVPIPNGVGTKNCGNPAPKRFSVYRNNVVVSLMEALAATFASTKALLGEANFEQISRAFVALHPPQSAMMQTYGETFPEFVENLPALSELPFLADLARVEWAWNEAVHAIDETPLDGDELASLSPEESLALVLKPMSATTLILSTYSVHALFLGRFDELDDDLDFDEPQNALVVRQDFDVQVIDLPQADALCLQKLLDGLPLGESVAAAMAIDPGYNPAQLIANCLRLHVFKSNS